MNVIRLYNIKPKEKLGQVFLIDERVLKREVEYAELSSKDVVLEGYWRRNNIRQIRYSFVEFWESYAERITLYYLKVFCYNITF